MWVNSVPDANIYRKFYDYDENGELKQVREYRDGVFVQSDEMLKKDDSFPYIGIWKTDCSNDFGYTVDKSDKEMYSLMFCGPGGCMEEEFWLKTTLENDKDFRIIDKDTFEMHAEGKFIQLHRCSS